MRIAIEKRIPVGGGLGGGSSDAATTLIALNALWKLDLPRPVLAELGLRLGADVPVFVYGRNAFATGIGEVLTPIDLQPRWYLVLTPPVEVKTRHIFADPALTRHSHRTTIAAFFAEQQGRNDLEPVVLQHYPAIRQHREWLERYAAARITGSGASVFAEFASEHDARAVLAQLPAEMSGFVAEGLDRHPLSP